MSMTPRKRRSIQPLGEPIGLSMSTGKSGQGDEIINAVILPHPPLTAMGEEVSSVRMLKPVLQEFHARFLRSFKPVDLGLLQDGGVWPVDLVSVGSVPFTFLLAPRLTY